MPWFPCSGDYLYIDASQLDGKCVTVRATPELLRQAEIAVAITGSNGVQELAGALTQSEPAASFLLTSGDEAARLVVTARDPTQASNTLTLSLPFRTVSLDLSSFQEYGPQTTAVTVQFHDSMQTAQFEFAPECGAEEPVVMRFSAGRTTGQYNYYSTELFKHRYRFRRAPEEDGPPTNWSDYRSPGAPLTIAVDRQVQ
jgi:hypothetical protein